MFIPFDEITELSNSIKILDVLKYYQLEPIQESSGRWKLRCTLGCFDKTPSLKVWEDTNSWYAYCCSNGGDPFQFIRLMEGDDFARAVAILAQLGKYKGSIDALLKKVEELQQGDMSVVEEQRRIYALNFMLGVAYRKALKRFKGNTNYARAATWTDTKFAEFDAAFTALDLSYEQATQYYEQQMALLKKKLSKRDK